MYKRILVPLDNSPTDEAILEHIRQMARLNGSALYLIHVADGFVARNQEALNLVDSEEMVLDREYLERRKAELAKEGFKVEAILRTGEPAKEILNAVAEFDCDLIAMSTHGHRFLQDLLLGSVATEVRHRAAVPVLLLRAVKK